MAVIVDSHVALIAHGRLHPVYVQPSEQMVLRSQLRRIPDTAQFAGGRQRGAERRPDPAANALTRGLGADDLLLLGARVLEPHLHDAPRKGDLASEDLALRHGRRPVVGEDGFHHADLYARHLRPISLVRHKSGGRRRRYRRGTGQRLRL